MKIMNKWLLFLLVVVLEGCNNWLDVKPADRVNEDKVFNSEKGFHSALNGIYIELIKPELYGVSMSCEMIELLAQRYKVAETNKDYQVLTEFKYTEDYVKGRLQLTWDAIYKLILNCNMILENAERQRNILSGPGYAVVRGEALALRAFLHFDMLRLFGPVYSEKPSAAAIPYVRKVSVSTSDVLPADTVVYGRILRDLKEAERLLLIGDPVVTDGPQLEEDTDNTYTFRSLRLNYFAVLALEARVYLYAGDKKNALEYARMLIGHPERENWFPFNTYTEIMGNEKNRDRVFSSDMLFGLFNTERSDIYKDYFDQENASASLLVPRVGAIETLFAGEEADYRYSLWQPSLVPGDKSLLCYRFKRSEEGGVYNNLMPLIRMSEMFLIAAECSENEEDAYEYLNTLRSHRGLFKVSDKLEHHLEQEYNKEFLCEGQLFFYYKRKNVKNLVSGTTGKNIEMSAAAYVPLLPESETKYRN